MTADDETGKTVSDPALDDALSAIEAELASFSGKASDTVDPRPDSRPSAHVSAMRGNDHAPVDPGSSFLIAAYRHI